MREVIVYNVASTTSFPPPAEQYRGYLLGFAVSTEVNDGIPETDTMAMIERQDGRVSMVLPNRIQFVQPYRAQLAATPAGIARACGMENEVEAAQEVQVKVPPKGWKIKQKDDPRKIGCLFWDPDVATWRHCYDNGWGEPINAIIANPIEVAP